MTKGRVAAREQGGEAGGRGASGGRDDGRLAGERAAETSAPPAPPGREEHEEHLVDGDAEQRRQHERVVEVQWCSGCAHRERDRRDHDGDGPERDGRVAETPQREPEREGEQARGERERARQLAPERRTQRRLEPRKARQHRARVERGDQPCERLGPPRRRVDVARHERLSALARDVTPRDERAQRADVGRPCRRLEISERLGEAVRGEARLDERVPQSACAPG